MITKDSPLKLPAQSHSLASMVVVLVLGLAAIYLVPFHVPVHDGLSDSYIFGFNNRTATVLLFVLALGFALWTRGLGLCLPDASQASKSFRGAGAAAVGCSIAGGIFLWLTARVFTPILEARYFLDRYAMYGMGARVYKDIEFDYGPLMFYLPVWIARIGHLSLSNSYYIAWILQCGLGTLVLWKVVEVAARGTTHGRGIFLLLWLFFVTAIPDSGVNYTPLRFCGTLAFALGVHRLYARRASNFAIFGLASIGATTMLLYSPEQGIAFILGTILFFAVCVRPARENLLMGLGCFIVVMAGVGWLAFRFGMLDNIVAVGGGALNFPLLFNFQSLVLLLLLIVAGCVVVASFRAGQSQHHLLYLICISIVSAPAAFSRADIGHIILNTLGALMASLIVLSQYPEMWRKAKPAFAVVVLLAGFSKFLQLPIAAEIHEAAFGVQYHSPAVEKAYTKSYMLTHANGQSRLDEIRARVTKNFDPDAPHLPTQSRLLAPLGVERRLVPFPDGIQVVTGRYPWLFPITYTAAVQNKIAEIEAHPDWPLLLSSRTPQVCAFDPKAERQSLRIFLVAPYLPPPRHTIAPGEPVCDYINANFVPSVYASPEPRSYVWVRKGSAMAADDTK